MARVKDIVRCVEGLAPLDTQEPWDNGGLLLGHPEQEVTGVLLALDVTLAVVQEAIGLGCNMILSHHPLFLRGLHTLREDRWEGRLAAAMIRAGMAHYAAHTSLDRAQGGTNDVLMDKLGLVPLQGGDFYRIGAWQGGPCGALLAHVRAVLGPQARLYGPQGAFAERVAVSGGAGLQFAQEARAAGAQVLITGDVKHHDALDALAAGLCIIDAGHRATERPVLDVLAACLQNGKNDVVYDVRVRYSEIDTYADL